MSEPVDARRAALKRASPLVLLGGMLAAYFALDRSRPRDNDLSLRLEGERQGVTEISVEVTTASGDEVLATSRWEFGPEGPPPRLRMNVRSSAGQFDVALRGSRGPVAVRPARARVELGGVPATVRFALDDEGSPAR